MLYSAGLSALRLLRSPPRYHTAKLAGYNRFKHILASDDAFLQTLLRNPELDLSTAKDELRWIKQESPHSTDVAASCERRGNGEPLQYILGTVDFGPLTLLTRSPTLIPRPETAHITTLLSERISASSISQPPKDSLRIADICTGSGCIALLLHHLLRDKTSITGYDISQDAITLAQENALRLGMDNEVDFRLGDIWKDGMMSEKVDMVVSNPPYIPVSEWRDLPASVREYEDPRALIGDPSDLQGVKDTESDGLGLAFYRRIAEMLPDVLEEEGDVERRGWRGMPRVAVEVGMGQAESVRRIFEGTKGKLIRRTEVWEDQYGVERMVVGFGGE